MQQLVRGINEDLAKKGNEGNVTNFTTELRARLGTEGPWSHSVTTRDSNTRLGRDFREISTGLGLWWERGRPWGLWKPNSHEW